VKGWIRLTLALGCLAFGLAQAPAQTPAAATPIKLRAAYLKSLSFSPLFLAKDAGYFRDEGIDLDLDIVQSASEVIAFLGSGQIDLAFGNIGVPLFNAAERGINVKIVAGISYYPTDPKALSPAPVLVKKSAFDSGEITKLADLKGRKVAFNTRGGVIEYLVAGAVARAGLRVADLDVVTMGFPNMAAAMSNGAIDAAVLPEPLATAARNQSIAAVLDPNPVPGALATVLMFGSSLLDPKSDASAQAVLRALRRAAADLSSPDKIMSPANVAIWARETELPPALVAKSAPYFFDKSLGVSVSDLGRQQDFLLSTQQITRSLPIDKLVDTRLAVSIP
jgi:NitT/TauT family transport system substrate-binding protein